MMNFAAGLLFVGIFCLNSGAFGYLPSGDACPASGKGPGQARLPSEVVFIDPSVPEVEKIVAQLPQGAEVVRLSPGTDAVAQISAHLTKKRDLSAIRIISHGNPGHFVLNGKRIDRDFLRNHGDRISAWSQALSENGDILLYACNLAATDEGKVFVEKFADLTGADIAASTDVTGGEAYNGNWDLEYSIGQVDTAALIIEPDADIKLDDIRWDGSASSVWTNGDNWSGDAVPGAGDDVFIPDPATTGGNDPNLPGAYSYNSFTVEDGGVVNFTNTTSQITGTSITIDGNGDGGGALIATDDNLDNLISLQAGPPGGAISLKSALITSKNGNVTLYSYGDLVITTSFEVNSTGGVVELYSDALISGSGSPDITIAAGIGSVDITQDIANTVNSLTISSAAQVGLMDVQVANAIAITGTNIDLNGNTIDPNNSTYTSKFSTVTFTGAVDLDFADDATTTITSGGGSGDNISFTSTIDGKNDNTQSLNLNAGAFGTINVTGAIGGTADKQLATLTITSSNGATFDAAVTTDTSVVLTDTTDATNITFTGALVTPTLTTQAQAYDLDLHGSGTTITNAVTFAHTGTLVLGNDAADTLLFNGDLTAIAPSGVTLNGQVRTSSGDTISLGDGNTAVTLAGTTSVLDTTNNGAGGSEAGAAITVGGAVDGTAANTQGLTVNGGTAGTATFLNIIGGTTPLATLTLTNGNLATGGNNITGSGITVNGGTFGLASSPSGNWDVGDVSVESGATMNATIGSFNVSGNWTNAGTFNHKDGTVTLDGTDQSISGSTNFHSLTKNVGVETAATLTFQNGTANRTTVEDTLNLQGAAGKLLSLHSASAGNQWEIDPQGTRTISYVNVKDSKNVNETAINASDSVDSGNNTNWTFPATATLATTTPTSYDCSVTKVEMYNGSGAWVTIFSGTAELDLVNGGTFPGISDVSLPAGTYSQIRVTFTNSFPLKGSQSYGDVTYYTTATTFGGQTNLASTPTTVAGSMAEYTFYNAAWGALNADATQTFAITPITVGPLTNYQLILRFTISDKLLLKGFDGTPSTYYFALSAPTVSIVQP